MIDWTNPACHVTDHFTVKECLWLHQWGRLANEDDGLNDVIKDNLKHLCDVLEDIRNLFGGPMSVHCMYRSPDYNDQIGAPRNDVHSMGMACDFDLHPNFTLSQGKLTLAQNLDSLNIRMERNTPTWIHVDTRSPGASGRYFTA